MNVRKYDCAFDGKGESQRVDAQRWRSRFENETSLSQIKQEVRTQSLSAGATCRLFDEGESCWIAVAVEARYERMHGMHAVRTIWLRNLEIMMIIGEKDGVNRCEVVASHS